MEKIASGMQGLVFILLEKFHQGYQLVIMNL